MKSYFILSSTLLALTYSAIAPTAHSQTPDPAPAAPALPPAAADEATLKTGKSVYNTTCMVCHQLTGLGMPSVYPPLKDSEWVAAPKPGRLIRIMLHGAMGPMTVAGKSYSNVMPSHGSQLTDDKIAAVITYIRHEYGNKASPVSPEYVAAARAAFKDRTAPWTEKELLAVPDK